MPILGYKKTEVIVPSVTFEIFSYHNNIIVEVLSTIFQVFQSVCPCNP